jgi:hypothetical protein
LPSPTCSRIFSDRLVAIGGHGPVAGEAGELHEILVERLAVGRVVHLGVELHGVEIAGKSAVIAKGAPGEVP